MKKILLLLLLASPASAQDNVDAQKLYLGPTGATCLARVGSGTPTAGATCEVYLNTANGDIWTKTSGGWLKVNTYGTVTSVGLTLPSEFTVSGSPVTTTGTLAASWASPVTVVHGGTGVATLTLNGVLYGNGTSPVQITAAPPANSVLAGNAGAPFFTATPTLTSLTATSDATIGGNAGTSSFVSQTTGWRVDSGGRADFRYLFTNEMRAKLFTADKESVLAGSQRITKSYSTISQAFTCPALGATATLWVKDAPTFGDAAIFVANDYVVIHTMTRTTFGPWTFGECVGYVDTYADGTGGNAGQQSWTFHRPAGATDGGGLAGGTVIPIDEVVQDFGVSGNGFVESTAVDGAGGVNAPYMQTATFVSTPSIANITPRCRLGNLNGITSVAESGLLCGDYAGNHYILMSEARARIYGIKLSMFDGATETMRLDPAVPSFALGSTLPSAYGTGTGIWMGKDTAYKFRVGDPASNRLAWDGSNLTLVSANLSITSAGIAIGVDGSASYDNGHAYAFVGTASCGITGTCPPGTFGLYGSYAGSGVGQFLEVNNTVPSGRVRSNFAVTNGSYTASLGMGYTAGTYRTILSSSADVEVLSSMTISTSGTYGTLNLKGNSGAAGGLIQFNEGATFRAQLYTSGASLVIYTPSGGEQLFYTHGAYRLGLKAGGQIEFGPTSYMKAASSYGVLINNSSDTLNLLQLSDNGTLDIYAGGANYKLRVDTNGDFVPRVDGTQHLGVPSLRFAYVTALAFNFTDASLDNKWSLTEAERVGIDQPGVALVDDTGQLIAFFGKDRFYTKPAADIDTLAYQVTTLDQRLKMDRTPQARIVGYTQVPIDGCVPDPAATTPRLKTCRTDGAPIYRTRSEVPLPDVRTAKTTRQRNGGGGQ